MEVVKTLRKGLVPRAGVEPARPFGQRILSPQRLPFRHPGVLSVTRFYQAFPLSTKSRISPCLYDDEECSIPLSLKLDHFADWFDQFLKPLPMLRVWPRIEVIP